MLQFMVRRMLTLILTMIALSMMVFALSEVVPLDPAVTILGRESTPQARAELRQSMGLNRPLPERYGRWLVRFVQGDWSKSYRLGADIRPLVVRRLQNSLTLAVLALLMISPISLLLGILAGLFHSQVAGPRHLDRESADDLDAGFCDRPAADRAVLVVPEVAAR